MPPDTESKFFRLRLPGPLHKKITDRSTRNMRTINAEVVLRLEDSVRLEDEQTGKSK